MALLEARHQELEQRERELTATVARTQVSGTIERMGLLFAVRFGSRFEI